MRISPEFIYQTIGETKAIKDQNARRAEKAAESRDIVAVRPGVAEARAADMDLREAQNTMTMFRIAENALAGAEADLARIGELAAEAASGTLTPAGINTVSTEAAFLASRTANSLSGATMGGVKLFGSGAETESLWHVAKGNADALYPEADNSGIAGVRLVTPDALGLGELAVSRKGGAARAADALLKVTNARATMEEQAVMMAGAVTDLASEAAASLSSALSTDGASAASALSKFVMDNLAYAGFDAEA